MPGPTTKHKIGSETFEITDAQPKELKEAVDKKTATVAEKTRLKTGNVAADNFMNKLLEINDEYIATMKLCTQVRVAQDECGEKIRLLKLNEFNPKILAELALFKKLKAQVAEHATKELNVLPEFTDEIKAQIPSVAHKAIEESHEAVIDMQTFCENELSETTEIHNKLLRIVNGLNKLKAAQEAKKAAAADGGAAQVAPASPTKTDTTKVSGPLFQQPKIATKVVTLNAGGQSPKPDQPSQKKV